MQCHNNDVTPVGVVPRRQARTLDSLMSDAPARTPCSVSEEVESPGTGRSSSLVRWLPGAAALGIVAATLEWLKLTR